MKALVTGFEPFGTDAINPALEALRLLPASFGTIAIETRVLPTVFGRSLVVLEEAIVRVRPDIALCVGVAGGRAALSMERVAINVDDARIPDNEGAQPIDTRIVADGPSAYFATLPVKAAVSALRAAGLPAVVSNTAGTFVCNHLFYGLMHLAATRWPAMRGGFLHLPYLPSQAAVYDGVASMALGDIVRGIEIVLATAATHKEDIPLAAGTLG